MRVQPAPLLFAVGVRVPPPNLNTLPLASQAVYITLTRPQHRRFGCCSKDRLSSQIETVVIVFPTLGHVRLIQTFAATAGSRNTMLQAGECNWDVEYNMMSQLFGEKITSDYGKAILNEHTGIAGPTNQRPR